MATHRSESNRIAGHRDNLELGQSNPSTSEAFPQQPQLPASVLFQVGNHRITGTAHAVQAAGNGLYVLVDYRHGPGWVNATHVRWLPPTPDTPATKTKPPPTRRSISTPARSDSHRGDDLT